MPQNSNLEPIELPMDLKFGEDPTTDFFNNLSALKIVSPIEKTLDFSKSINSLLKLIF